jgi:hypothetical protein
MTATPVADRSLFLEALQVLSRVKVHGDTLALYLALKFHQDSMPRVGDDRLPLPTGDLEDLLDGFYQKPNASAGHPGPVCMLFNNRFRPLSSYSSNNWRDFFRYGLGVACLGGEPLLQSDFVGKPRSSCEFLTTNAANKPACANHPKKTAYIRGLGKPKLLHWDLARHAYKVVDLDHRGVLEALKPVTSWIPLESLLIGLYHDAIWNDAKTVTLRQFADDFHFPDVSTVEYLFSIPPVDPALRKKVAERSIEVLALRNRPFQMVVDLGKTLSLVERRIREVAFRSLVGTAYDNACAVCNLRVKSKQDHWEVQAAHIYPHGAGGTDDIRNGIAMCRTHHWAFDEHLFTIDRGYNVVWGRGVPAEWRRFTKLALPDNEKEWPDQDQALEWHRSKMRQ